MKFIEKNWLLFNNWQWKTFGSERAGNELILAVQNERTMRFAGALLIENSLFESKRRKETLGLWRKALRYYKDQPQFNFVADAAGNTSYDELSSFLAYFITGESPSDSTLTRSIERIENNIKAQKSISTEKW